MKTTRIFLRPLVFAAVMLIATATQAQTDPAARGSFTVRREIISARRISGFPGRLKVYLPLNAGAARPTILFLHGFSALPSFYDKAAENMASRGYAVALFDQVNILDPDFRRWVPAGSLALDALVAANADAGSPIFGELDAGRMGCVGHSYGSVTALGMSAVDARVKTVVMWAPGAVPFDPFPRRAAAQATVPTLVLASQFDRVAPPSLVADPVWDNLNQPERLFLEIKDASHNNYLDFTFERLRFDPRRFRFYTLLSANEQRTIALRYTNAWLDKHLRGLPDPRGHTDGSFAQQDRDLSRVLKP